MALNKVYTHAAVAVCWSELFKGTGVVDEGSGTVV